MVEKDKIWSGKVKHTGIMDFKELYVFCYTWLSDNNYYTIEKTYSEKIKGPTEKEIEIEWLAFRKISDYFRFYLKFTWKIILTSVEVERNGKREKAEKGILDLKIDGVLEKDYEHKWEGRPLYKFLRGLYDKYVIRSRIEQYEEKLYGEIEDFRAQVKSFLALTGK